MAGETTRVPVYAQMHEFAAAQLKIPGEIFYTRPDIMVPAELEIQSRFGLDVASLTFDVVHIEAEALGQRVIFTDANMADVDRSMPLVREHSDLARIKTPDFDSAGRFVKVIEAFALFKQLTGLEPPLSFCAPFSLAANLRGIESLLMDIYTDPDSARAFRAYHGTSRRALDPIPAETFPERDQSLRRGCDGIFVDYQLGNLEALGRAVHPATARMVRGWCLCCELGRRESAEESRRDVGVEIDCMP